jgi:DNA replication initiation complex subunit (GINS family)
LDEKKSAVTLTYETLYELLRREKEHDELQKLDPEFFSNVLHYIQEKQKLFDEASRQVDIFSISERDKLMNQLSNIRRLVKELYDRRERKILEMALNKSRTNSAIIDTSNLLEEERQLFSHAAEVLQGFRQGLLQNVLELKPATLKPLPPSSLPAVPGASLTPYPPSTAPPAGHHGHHGRRRITFLQRVERFVDKELNTHGPFDPEAIAELPDYLAAVLIAKGAASELRTP